MKLSTELRDIKNILFNKEQYKADVMERLDGALPDFANLLGTGKEKMSPMFWLINRHNLYLLDNNPDIAVTKKYIDKRRKLYNLVRALGSGMIACTQIIENKDYIDNPDSVSDNEPVTVNLPDKPVIIAANHGFRDDVLATVLAAGRHGITLWGSIPMFYNTFNGFASNLVGVFVVNRKSKSSRQSALAKTKKTIENGADLIIFPEGGWNKSCEKMALDLWKGVYDISKESKCDVVPIIHYNRELEVLDKKNIIHTIVDDPIPLYEMEKEEALIYLRDLFFSWQWKMAEIYGKSTRDEELKGFENSREKWAAHLTERMKVVDWYDADIEKNSEYRPKDKIRPEDVFRPIANIKNITARNVKDVIYAQSLVKTIEESDWQKLY